MVILSYCVHIVPTSAYPQTLPLPSQPPVVDCMVLPDPDNGEVDLSNGTTFGSIAVYNCNEGLILLGSDTRVCQADGVWSGDPPTCGET